ncbi:fluoride efflux transporter CrcB [Thalassobacillus sp. CUG 92003]|uniref:fluoride efflux transporter CrcB n=1 Tax=Thalassobacillus sp. CUG 92003 TaxID=2736641 RepID=UPI0015E66B62|nr:fluoride efflux transporter CrcB [Thalassobacillus sp. CUG 92003]
MIYIAVGIGGVIGSLLRYYISVYTGYGWGSTFPFDTFLANLIGCFLLGWVTTYLAKMNWLPSPVSLGIGTGLIGSFTTFSTFSFETVALIKSSEWLIAISYVLGSLWGGLLLAYLGYRVGRGMLQNSIRKGS